MPQENLSALIEQQAAIEEAFLKFRVMHLDDADLANQLRSVSNGLASISQGLKRRIEYELKTV
jgi:hypothetical protein